MRLFLDSSIGLSISDLMYISHFLALLLSLSPFFLSFFFFSLSFSPLSFSSLSHSVSSSYSLYPVSFSLVLLAITSALPAHSSTLFTYRDTDTVSLQHV